MKKSELRQIIREEIQKLNELNIAKEYTKTKFGKLKIGDRFAKSGMTNVSEKVSDSTFKNVDFDGKAEGKEWRLSSNDEVSQVSKNANRFDIEQAKYVSRIKESVLTERRLKTAKWRIDKDFPDKQYPGLPGKGGNFVFGYWDERKGLLHVYSQIDNKDMQKTFKVRGSHQADDILIDLDAKKGVPDDMSGWKPHNR
jgi:hypothetical protein